MKRSLKKVTAAIISATMLFSTCMNVAAAEVEQQVIVSEQKDDQIEILSDGNWIGDLANQTSTYEKNDGEKAVGLKEIEGKVYYFNEYGIVQSGWQKVKIEKEDTEESIEEIKEYYFSPTTGERYEDRTEIIDSVTYEFDEDGNFIVVKEQEEVEAPQEEVLEDSHPQPESNVLPEAEVKPEYEEKPEIEDLPEANKESNVVPEEQANGFAEVLDRMKAGWNDTAEGKIYILENGNRAVGMQTIKDALYYFNESGILQIGWIQWNGNKYFAAADGKLYRNQQISFGKTVYCMGEDGSVQYGLVDLKGTLYYADRSTGEVIHKAGWIVDSHTGKKYFAAADGKLYRNQQISFGKTVYCMGEDGSVQYGIVNLNGSIYHTDETTGQLIRQAGWIEKDGKKYFAAANGKVYNAQLITFGKIWYCMGEDGSVQYGLVDLKGTLYYADRSTGEVIHKAGWIVDSHTGKKYFAAADGKLYKNQQISFGKTVYCMGEDGSVQYGVAKIGAKYYYTDERTGILVRKAGWIEKAGKRYFANDKGELYHDQFISFGSTYYYCGSEAFVLTGEQAIDGVLYHMDTNGMVIKEGGWGEYNGNKYYKNPATGMPYRSQFVTFGKTWYYANAKGIMVSGWQNIQGYRYYFYPETKIMARNTTIDGIKIGPDGRTVTAKDTLNQIHATNGVRYWNTDYKLSGERKRRLESAMAAFSKRSWNVSFVMVDLHTGQGLTYKPTSPMYSASTIKGPYVMSLLNAGYAPNSTMWNAIKYSDNNAYASLRRTYGPRVFEQWLANAGVSRSQGSYDYVQTSALDLAKMWMYGYDTVFAKNTSSANWAKSTFQNTNNSRISSSLASKKTVYSKPGWTDYGGYYDVLNDAGIVMDGEFPYILAITSGAPGTDAYTEGHRAMEELARQLDLIHSEMVR